MKADHSFLVILVSMGRTFHKTPLGPRRIARQVTCIIAKMKCLKNMPITNVELLKLGYRIKASRQMLGPNQKDFSNQCGLDRSYFDGVERGEHDLTFSSLCQICACLNCDIAAVTKGIPHPKAA